MANMIKAKIYKNRFAAAKFAKKVNGKILRNVEVVIHSHGPYKFEMEHITYIVYYGKYIPI
jgi:hypothetical protein